MRDRSLPVTGRTVQRLLLVAVALAVAPIAAYAAFAVAPWGEAYVVASGSMEPTIDTGSIAFVIGGHDYDTGDVVTFERDGATVTHRIVDRTDGGYVTAGDANGAPDDWIVPEDRIIGAVIGTVPHYGSVLAFAGTPLGYVLFVLLPSLALIGRELASIRDHR